MHDPERVCDGPSCSNPAVVHLAQIENGKVSNTKYWCKSCAEAKGISTKTPSSFERSDAAAEESCTFCDTTMKDFKDTGLLGCPHCYTSFEPGLRRLLNRIHGSSQHLGKVYLPPDPSARDLDARVQALRRRLRRAVDAEDFERAALLRDRIRELEPAG